MKNRILVTGGAGYIGSHMVRMLIEKGYPVTIFDNLSTGKRALIHKRAEFVLGDLREPADVKRLFAKRRFGAVIHFAASIIVPESVAQPLKYYTNNVSGTVNLLEVIREKKIRFFVFSSTAATYGEPKRVPVKEDDPQKPTNPYGGSKLMVEQVLRDLAKAEPAFRFAALRYFNVCGAHPSGELGPLKDKETLLLPNVLRAIRFGAGHGLKIFGDDYPTPDGTCLRDYIHVMDLCSAHLKALGYLTRGGKSDFFNLGNGRGYSVKEIVRAAERLVGKPVPHTIVPRRPGDPSRIVASPAKAARVLGWKPGYDLRSIIETAWRWELKKDALARRLRR
jgi:UDP-glucose 4-epimerase